MSEGDKVISSKFFNSTFLSQAKYLVCEPLDILVGHVLGGCPESGRVQVNAFLGWARHVYLTGVKIQGG